MRDKVIENKPVEQSVSYEYIVRGGDTYLALRTVKNNVETLIDLYRVS